MTKDEILKEIRAALDKKGWSIAVFARQSQVSHRAIRGFLDGTDEVSPQVLYRFCKLLGLDKHS